MEIICKYCKKFVSNNKQQKNIIVHGAKEHNLKNICFEIPKGKLVALTGPSGSGKSSIATDILQKECIRQYLESLGMTTDHIEKAKADYIAGLSPSIGIPQCKTDFNPRSTIGTKTGTLAILRNMFASMGQQLCTNCNATIKPLQKQNNLETVSVAKENDSSKEVKKNYFDCSYCNYRLEKLSMNHFSLNTIEGACNNCKGLGAIFDIDTDNLIDEQKTIKNGGIKIWNESLAKYYESIIIAASKYYNFDFDSNTPIKNYTEEQKNFLLYGINSSHFKKKYQHLKAPKKVSEGNFEGLITSLTNQYKKNPEKIPNDLKKYIVHKSCIECNNTGLSKISREVTINGKTIVDVINFNLNELLKWLVDLKQYISKDEAQIFDSFSNALQERICNLIEVGLEYLTLNRSLPSISVGEAQRVRLANILGSNLTGVLYVLDEPTTGLHPNDSEKILKALRKIQEAGNTVLVIEHDMDIIKQVDYIIDIGPSSGFNGGEIVATGTPTNIINCNKSITGKYLSKNNKFVAEFKELHNSSNKLIITGASEHNLKNINVNIPIKQLVVLTGVSGSGKSTLLFDILEKAAKKHFNRASEVPGKYHSIEGLNYFNRVITIDQTTIGNSNSSRSNIATYTKLFDLIRELFASLPDSKIKNFNADKFSFNTSDQRCENCSGTGTVEVDMAFMPNLEVVCQVCNGSRFNEELLSIKFKGKNISNILDMTINDALIFFKNEKKIFSILNIMQQVGLEYLKLGQSTSTLSGGEAQRIKLATELSKAENGNTLYLLDEPTTGMHPKEVDLLIDILKNLISRGNTIVTIEHNLDFIRNADTIIDFGPESGPNGGNIIATGTPQEIINNANSLIGKFL